MRGIARPRILWLAAAVLTALFQPSVPAWDVRSTISPSITAHPIEIVIWVKSGVDPADEARVLADIQSGLALWADVPTSEIDFEIVDVIHSTTNPGKLPHQIEITIGNRDDLTSGGASFPSGGNPGTWFGAVADLPTIDMVAVAAHEIGHTLGFLHSTISVEFPVEHRPNMHFSLSGPRLLPDDVAAISTVYPMVGGPGLQDVGGTIRGTVVSSTSGAPLTGVNVVAVEPGTGVPAVARISGASGIEGEFALGGLPPGTYEVRFLDGHSYLGSFVGLGTTLGLAGRFQADNFVTHSTEEVPIAIGDDFDLGEVELTMRPLSIDRVHVGPIGSFGDVSFEPVETALPAAVGGEFYEIWLPVVGGVRELTISVTGLPAGLSAFLAIDPRSANTGIRGSRFVRILGTPDAAGIFSVDIRIDGAHGASATLPFALAVCGADVDDDGEPDCTDTCIDADGDGYGVPGIESDTCLGADCDDQHASVYAGARETNDGMDNQCPGDDGYGLADEMGVDSGFHDPGDRHVYSWSPQPGALSYEVLRSIRADLSGRPLNRFVTSDTWLRDPAIPAASQTFYYLNRTAEPFVGSLGWSSSGERTVPF